MAKRSIQKLHPLESLGNAPARVGDIRVERLEDRLRPRVPFPHKHDFYHLLLIEKGTGWHEIDFHRYPVRGGRLFLVRPGEVHAWKLGRGTRGFVLEFHSSSLRAPFREKWRALPPLLDLARAEEARSLLTLMMGEFVDKSAYSALALDQYLGIFVLTLLREEPVGKKSGKRQTSVEAFAELLEKNFTKQHSVDFYARLLKMNPKALSRATQKTLGRTAGTMIHERCLLEAKRLLAYSDLSIAEIGYELGFDDPNYFARFFRQRTELAPGKFRALARHTIH